MKVQRIIDRAAALGLPIAENEFKKTKETPLPNPPYLIYYEDESTTGGGDNIALYKKRKTVLELYTTKKCDEALEKKIEQEVLHDIGYGKYQALIQSEELVQTAWDFVITEKIPKGERQKNG